jgi:hypothetical protein
VEQPGSSVGQTTYREKSTRFEILTATVQQKSSAGLVIAEWKATGRILVRSRLATVIQDDCQVSGLLCPTPRNAELSKSASTCAGKRKPRSALRGRKAANSLSRLLISWRVIDRSMLVTACE